uniref:Uncharacterized protein n=1 Tax=Tanacetum cinerariifolium TaxID=118510 RepID=A0A6L2LDM8_TANCI|nr:hypothetical protein [Tanacetum cinerariifolium]
MTTTSTQQVALDNALVHLEKRVEIGKCNMKIGLAKTQKEPTYQFWFTGSRLIRNVIELIWKYSEKSSRSVLDFRIETLMNSRQMTNFSLSLKNFDTKEMLYMSLKWSLIKCANHGELLLQSSTSAYLGKLQVLTSSDSQELKFYGKCSIRRIILGPMRFVSKSDAFQVYGSLLPNSMTNQKMLDSDAYKTYLAYATGASSPKMKKKLKKPTSPLKKKTLVIIEKEEPEPAKKVPDEPKGKSINTNEGTGLKPGVPDVSKDYVPTNDELNDVTKEEYKRISEELYGDVNVSLTYTEPGDKEKDDVEMTVAGHVNINQEDVGNQVNDDAQVTQKTKGPILSSFISSDYAAKYLNFDNIRPVDTKVVSMLDINVQHEVPQTSPLLTNRVFIIPEHNVINPLDTVITASATTISSFMSSLFSHLQQSTPILTPTTTKATTSTTTKNVADIIKEHYVPAETVERLRQHYAPQKSVEHIREIKMKHARKQQVPKDTITSSDITALAEFDQKTTLFEIMTKSKSFNKSLKQQTLYHALMDSILKDKDVMDESVADELKKRKPDDADKDSVGSDRGLKRQKTKKHTEPSKKAKTFDDLMSTPIDFSAFVMNHLQISELTQDILVGPAYNILKCTCKSYVELDYNMEECYKALTDQLDWNNPEGDRYPFDLSKPLPLVMHFTLGSQKTKFYRYASNRESKHDVYSTKRILAAINVKVKEWYGYGHLEEIKNRLFNLKGDVIVHLAAALRMFTRRIMIQKRLEDLQLGFIYVDKLGRNRLICSHELYKFSDGTLISLLDTLKDMANNLDMGYKCHTKKEME